jgi:hypothetical protein
LVARHAFGTVRIGLDHASVDGEALAADQALAHAASQHRLEDVAECIALAESAVSVLREG